jgi:hypothetical protein
MPKRDTLVTIRTTRECTFLLSEWRDYFGEPMTAQKMRQELTNDNGQAAHQYHQVFGDEITDQTFTVEPQP